MAIRDHTTNEYIKELDPRAIKFVASYKSAKPDGIRKLHPAEFDWCNENINDHLYIVNNKE